MLKDDVNLVYDFLHDEYGDSPFFPAMVRIKTALAESTNSSHNKQSTPLPACITCAVPNCGMKAGYCGSYKPQ